MKIAFWSNGGEKMCVTANMASIASMVSLRNEACDAGKITVNDKVARASYDVKVGDVIEITLGSKSVKVKVTEVKEVVRKEDAATMYEAAV